MFNVSMSRVFFPGENRYYLVDVHYKVVPSFPYNLRLNAAFVLFGAAYIFNFASICAVKSRVACIRVITVYKSTFLISTGIFFSVVVLVFKQKLLTYIISDAAKISQ